MYEYLKNAIGSYIKCTFIKSSSIICGELAGADEAGVLIKLKNFDKDGNYKNTFDFVCVPYSTGAIFTIPDLEE